jgi:hypothetical protein
MSDDPKPVAEGQIRVRADDASTLASAPVVLVSAWRESHGAFQLYDAATWAPCGGWSPEGIARDYSTVVGAVQDMRGLFSALARRPT